MTEPQPAADRAMTPTQAVPTFAVVGAVNHGKSSVVATLAENDQVRISRMPGETVQAQRFALKAPPQGGASPQSRTPPQGTALSTAEPGPPAFADLFVFHDTPGFQNARAALVELRPAAGDAQPLQRFAQFVARHRDDPAFEAECRLFEPVVLGAGIIYVVDAARPLREIHQAEMELMRLTGAPRLAIINRTGPDDHAAAWKLKLGQHFNAVREFDAHQADFADRIELLETLAGIEQRWKPRLMQAVRVLQQDRSRRLDRAAQLIAQWLARALTYREEERSADEADQAILERYRATLASEETAAHASLIALFSHRHVHAATDAGGLLADGLFSDATWSLLGLDARQLLGAGTATGAAMGAGTDLLTAGHTLMLGTAIGAAVGAAGALALGKRQPELGVRLPGKDLPAPLRALVRRGLKVPERWRLAGRQRGVGPYAAANFPWILIDRAVATLACVAQRAHARRDDEQLDSARLQALLAERHLASNAWPAETRRRAEQAFVTLRTGADEHAVATALQTLQDLVRAGLSHLDDALGPAAPADSNPTAPPPAAA